MWPTTGARTIGAFSSSVPLKAFAWKAAGPESAGVIFDRCALIRSSDARCSFHDPGTIASVRDEDGRLARGRRTRRRLLERAAAVASERGLDALSLAQLAADLGLSKSGVAALYGSKEALQLATIQHARQVFIKEVVAPAWGRPAGAERLVALLRSWLEYIRAGVFPGGCFIQRCVAEQAGRQGALQDSVAEARREWLNILAAEVRVACASRATPGVEAQQVAFELDALLAAGSLGHILGDPHALRQAETACLQRVYAVSESASDG